MDLINKGILVYVGLLISLLVLSFGIIDTGLEPVSASETIQGDSGAAIVLEPSSEARFFDCGVTPSVGSSALLDLSAEKSALSALTDEDLDTIVMGSAVLEVSSSSNLPIVNNPGADLMVVEMAGAEPINSSVTDPETGDIKFLVLMPTFGNNTNDCDMAMNQVFIDLSSFGVPEGSSVSSVHFDNLGDANSLLGSDIAEIFILEPKTSNASQPTEFGYLPFLPFFR